MHSWQIVGIYGRWTAYLSQQERTEASVAKLSLWIKIRPDAQAHLYRGTQYKRMENWSAAVDDFREYLRGRRHDYHAQQSREYSVIQADYIECLVKRGNPLARRDLRPLGLQRCSSENWNMEERYAFRVI